MKALTLTQPWATLVAIGAKRIETRSWRSSYRGPLAIHAAKGFPRSARDFQYAMVAQQFGIEIESLHLGCVLATARLVGCLPMESEICLPGVFEDYPELDTPQERAFGDFSAGRWAWIIEDVVALPQPIPARGALSLWSWEGHAPEAGAASSPNTPVEAKASERNNQAVEEETK